MMTSLKEWLNQFSPETSAQPPLDIYFLGDGVGESIIIRLGTKFTSVIDAFGGDEESITKTVLEYLNIKTIDYLQVSHLHNDHYCGINVLLENFQIKGFGRPNLVKFTEIVQVARFIEMKKANSQDVRKSSLVTFLSKVKQNTKSIWSDNPLAYKHVGASTDILKETFEGHSFHYDCIAPLAHLSEKYLEKIDKIIEKLRSEGVSYISDGLLNKFDPAINRSSIINRIEYGGALVLLTGDTESLVLDSFKYGNIKTLSEIKNLIVKIPHHGSKTSDAKILFDASFSRCKKLAVVCPYNSQGLPEESVIQKYLDSEYEVFRTSSFDGLPREATDSLEPTGVVRIRIETNGNTSVAAWGSAAQEVGNQQN